MITSYNTLRKKGEGLFKEKGSKFIGLAFHVKNQKDVEAYLSEIRKKYYDARHHCYAYIIDDDGKTYRANDDGEPKHSAGDPILGQVKSNSLTYALIVVVRYFGGTKLGVSGLINAYKTAAKEAIDDAGIINLPVSKSLSFVFSYEYTNDVMKLISEYSIEIDHQIYESECRIDGLIPVENMEMLKKKVEVLNHTGTEIVLNTGD